MRDSRLGRIFMAGMPGPDLDDGTRQLISDYGVNNFILFKRNVIDPVQLAKLCHDLKTACKDEGLHQPLISIDQEGGRVARLGSPFTLFAGASAMASSRNPEAEVRKFAEITARELKLVGCNMDLAPVLDLQFPDADPVMDGRTLGAEPNLVGHLGSFIVEVLQREHVLATAKHFPGIGRVRFDPHQDLPVIEASSSELWETDIKPFQKAIAAGVSAVMTAHVIYPALDKDHPATLSENILSGILRNKLGFEGLVITDDLEMGAIEKHFSLEDAAVKAFMAGVDLLLFCHEKDKIVRAIERIKHLTSKTAKGDERLKESAVRILKAKESFGISTDVIMPSENQIRAYFGAG